MPATPSEIDVVPPTLPGFSTPVPVTVRIRTLGGVDATTYTTFNGSTAHPVAARITTTTSFFFEGNINTGPWVVTCTTDGGQVVASQTLVTGPTFNPAVVQCSSPVDASSISEVEFLGAGDIAPYPGGSPVLGILAGAGFSWAAWLLDDTTVEYTAGEVWIPAHWSTFNIDAYWSRSTSAAGAVKFNLFRRSIVDGVTMDASSTMLTVTDTAPTQYFAKVTRIGSNLTNTSGVPLAFNFGRDASNAADTLVGDVAILGLAFSRAS